MAGPVEIKQSFEVWSNSNATKAIIWSEVKQEYAPQKKNGVEEKPSVKVRIVVNKVTIDFIGTLMTFDSLPRRHS